MAINGTKDGVDRCGSGCDSSTTTPAIIYFPHGTYLITSPLLMFYYTQMVGDATNLPTIKGSSSFYGIALLDSDQYYPGGANWYTNQNNFYRQVRLLGAVVRELRLIYAGPQLHHRHDRNGPNERLRGWHSLASSASNLVTKYHLQYGRRRR